MSSIKIPVTYLGKVRSGTTDFGITDLIDEAGDVHPGVLEEPTATAWRDVKAHRIDAIGPYKLKPGTGRANANVEYVTALVLDIDQTLIDLTENSWDELLPHPDLGRLKHYVVSSPSNGWKKEDDILVREPGNHSWKVIYPLDGKMSPTGLGKLQRSMVTLTAGTLVEVDRQTHDASRPCYRFQALAPNFAFAEFNPDGPLMGRPEAKAIVDAARALDPAYVDNVKAKDLGKRQDPTQYIVDRFRRRKGGEWWMLSEECPIWVEDLADPTTVGELLRDLMAELASGLERDKLRGTLFGGSIERCLINVMGGMLIISDGKTGNHYGHRPPLTAAQDLRDRPLPRTGRLDQYIAITEMQEAFGDSIVADENGFPYIFDKVTCTWASDMKLTRTYQLTTGFSGRLQKRNKQGDWTAPFGWTRKWGMDTARAFADDIQGTLNAWDEGLAFRDGLLRYDGSFRPRGPGDHVIDTDVLPYDYVAGAGCPAWLAFLDDVIVQPLGEHLGPRMIDMVQMYLGACLAGKATKCNAMMVLYGGGANGKTVFLDVVQALFSPSGVASSVPDEWADPTRRSALYGAKVNVVSDVGKARWKDTGVIKQVLGGERVSMRYLYKDTFPYRPIAGHWFSLNALPSVWDDSTGWTRRCRVVPFLRQFKAAEQDRGLTSTLLQELPGIALWALEGLRKAEAADFKLPHIESRVWKAWEEGNKTTTSRFIDDWLRPGNTWYNSSDLFLLYKRYTIAQGDQPINGTTFRKELRAQLALRGVKEKARYNKARNKVPHWQLEHLEPTIIDGTFGSP